MTQVDVFANYPQLIYPNKMTQVDIFVNYLQLKYPTKIINQWLSNFPKLNLICSIFASQVNFLTPQNHKENQIISNNTMSKPILKSYTLE